MGDFLAGYKFGKDIAGILERLERLEDDMATAQEELEELKTANDEQDEALTTEIDQINAKLDALATQIAQGVSADQLVPLVDQAKARTARIKAIIADEEPPPVPTP